MTYVKTGMSDLSDLVFLPEFDLRIHCPCERAAVQQHAVIVSAHQLVFDNSVLSTQQASRLKAGLSVLSTRSTRQAKVEILTELPCLQSPCAAFHQVEGSAQSSPEGAAEWSHAQWPPS